MKAGPTLESAFRAKVTNDNGSMAIASVETVSNPTRVYNLSIESRPGEITHNYLVGDDMVWVHNQPKDKRFGLPNAFWRWYHRKIKRPGDSDCGSREAKGLFEEWVRLGKPGADAKNRGRRRRR